MSDFLKLANWYENIGLSGDFYASIFINLIRFSSKWISDLLRVGNWYENIGLSEDHLASIYKN